jgi:sugar phosphate isomerase/epimerase
MDALRYAQAHLFAGVQVAIEYLHLNPDRMFTAGCEEVGRFRARHQLSISLHPPTLSLYESARVLPNAILGYYEDLFMYAKDMGASIIVLHLGAPPTFPTDTQPVLRYPPQILPLLMRTMKDNLKRIVDANQDSVTLAIENVNFEPPVLEAIQPMLGIGGLSLCWDLPKTYKGVAVDEELEQFFWRNLRHVKQVHLHDIRDGRQHKVLGTGCVDFLRFLPRLAQAEVMEYVLEVRPREKALESLQNLRKLVQEHTAAPVKR